MKSFRGLEAKHERGAREMARDTRPLGVRVAEFLSDPNYAVMILGCCAGTGIVMPYMADVSFLVGACEYLFVTTRRVMLPMKMPLISKSKDYNDTIPGTDTPRKAAGIAFLGNEQNTKKELWATNDDMRTHLLIFGSTGSGKTEGLVSLAFNSLVQGSGFIYVDGKGDNSLYAKVFSMVRRMGRDDDLLLVNFMTGARDIMGPQKTRLSNTMNPFALGSSGMLSNLVVSLMDSGGSGEGGDMWKGRAISFVESILKVLVAMRDEGHILLDANTIRNYFALEKLEQIVVDKRFPVSDTQAVPLDALPSVVLDPLNNYLGSLPGYNPSRKGNQVSEVREQHGFIIMQLTRIFNSLADTYGHIIRTNLAEVDFKDVVLNRRIMVVLLPALEKSVEELSNLGKVIVASLKAMMASGLGDQVEGTYRDVIQRKPTTSPSPYVCIMDEYGYYAVKGFAVVPAQARSLGFCAIFAGQDLPAFQKAGKEEAASIGANTNIKICMKLEDPGETWDFFNKTAGETYATSAQSFQTDPGSFTTNYMDSRSATTEKRQRLDLLDLKDQREGDAHIFYRSNIIRARLFYANPKPVKELQVNQLLCVEKPSDLALVTLDRRLRRFNQVYNDPYFRILPGESNEDIDVVAQAFVDNEGFPYHEQATAALVALLENELRRQKRVTPFELEEGSTGEVHAFTRVVLSKMATKLVPPYEHAEFSEPLLPQVKTRDALIHIERMLGKQEAEAVTVADNLMKEIVKSTYYPPAITLDPDPHGVAEAIHDFIDSLLLSNARAARLASERPLGIISEEMLEDALEEGEDEEEEDSDEDDDDDHEDDAEDHEGAESSEVDDSDTEDESD